MFPFSIPLGCRLKVHRLWLCLEQGWRFEETAYWACTCVEHWQQRHMPKTSISAMILNSSMYFVVVDMPPPYTAIQRFVSIYRTDKLTATTSQPIRHHPAINKTRINSILYQTHSLSNLKILAEGQVSHATSAPLLNAQPSKFRMQAPAQNPPHIQIPKPKPKSPCKTPLALYSYFSRARRRQECWALDTPHCTTNKR